MASGDIIRLGGGTDWSQYTPFNKAGIITTVTPDADFVDVLNILGEGFLSFFAFASGGTNDGEEWRVYKDGVLIADLGCDATTRGGGIIEFTTMSTDSSNYPVIFTNGGKWSTGVRGNCNLELPFTSKSIGLCLLPCPVFFSQSLVIKRKYITGDAYEHKYQIIGGVK